MNARRAFQVLAACLFLAAMSTSASAMDAPVYTHAEDYPLPTGMGSWASVMADVLMNRVRTPTAAFLSQTSWQSTM
jgi:hypothetical protein